jgi:hypothetical protein
MVNANEVNCEESRIRNLFSALIRKGGNFSQQREFNEAKTVYEKCYNLVAEAYYVDHPIVLEAANHFIMVLIHIEEYEVA